MMDAQTRDDPYQHCPEFDTARFHLRQVREEDAGDLLCFYGDAADWMFFANAVGDQHIFTNAHPPAAEVAKLIRFWLEEYRNRVYLRLSVIDKATGKAVGTIELCHTYLHLDLSAPYETREAIAELLTLADREFFALQGVPCLQIKALPDATERLAALAAAGYRPSDREAAEERYFMKKCSGADHRMPCL